MARYERECPPDVMDSEDSLFLLYTSGSTGKPKGVVHSQAGYLLYAAFTHNVSFISKLKCQKLHSQIVNFLLRRSVCDSIISFVVIFHYIEHYHYLNSKLYVK